MLSLVFIYLLTIPVGCRSVKRTTKTRTIDTVYKIKSKRLYSLQPYVDNNDTLVFDTKEFSAKIYGVNKEASIELRKLSPRIMADIELKERKIDIKAKETLEIVDKENDNPIKNFFFVFGIIAFVLVLIYVIAKIWL